MTLLANILQGDRTDLDLIQLVLETLSNVITHDATNDEGRNLADLSNEGRFAYIRCSL